MQFFCKHAMLFNGKFVFCQFPMLFNGNLRLSYKRTDGCTDVWKFTPASYRTSALWGRCPKRVGIEWKVEGRKEGYEGRKRREKVRNEGKEGRNKRNNVIVQLWNSVLLWIFSCMCNRKTEHANVGLPVGLVYLTWYTSARPFTRDSPSSVA